MMGECATDSILFQETTQGEVLGGQRVSVDSSVGG